MQIELKELIKPKFAIGQTVYIRCRDSRNVTKAEIQDWEMTMRSSKGPTFTYLMRYGSNWFSEGEMYATSEEAFAGVSVK